MLGLFQKTKLIGKLNIKSGYPINSKNLKGFAKAFTKHITNEGNGDRLKAEMKNILLKNAAAGFQSNIIQGNNVVSIQIPLPVIGGIGQHYFVGARQMFTDVSETWPPGD